jgi:hypothetical protein
MYTISKSVLKNILQKKFSSLVGKSCKRIEVIRDMKDTPVTAKLDLIRLLIKELNYETMRDLEETISAFSEGTKIQVNFNKPEPQ